MTKGWTPQRRLKQAKNCLKTKPWEKSTGPKTLEGKNSVKNNAFKHGFDSKIGYEIRHTLYEHKKWLNHLIRLFK